MPWTHLAAIIGALMPIAGTAFAQGLEPRLDARLPRPGGWSLEFTPSWMRYDALGGVAGRDGSVALGDLFSGPLDRTAFPPLAASEAALATLTGQPTVSITAGDLVTGANVRVATVPITIRYGISRRLALRVMVPLIESRANVVPRLNEARPNPLPDNLVGPNPAGFFGSATALAQNAAVETALRQAASQLAARVASCQANPSAAGCADVNARRAEAQALGTDAERFADAASVLYGTGEAKPGQAFVPITQSALQKAVEARLAAIRSSFSSFGIPAGGGVFAAAGGPAARDQLQRLVTDPRFGIGRDSLGRTTRYGIGDVEVGAALQLFDSFGDSAASRPLRMLVEGTVRVPTGQEPLVNRAFDVGLGAGVFAIEGRGVLDVGLSSRVSATVAAQAIVPIGEEERSRLPGIGGSLFPLAPPVSGTMQHSASFAGSFVPRFALTRYLRLDGQYMIVRDGGDQAIAHPTTSSMLPLVAGRTSSTEQRAGLGLSYAAGASPVTDALPFEMSVSHVRTLTASGGPVPLRAWTRVGLSWYF